MANIQPKPLVAYSLALIAHLCFCTQNYLIKKVQRSFSSSEVQYYSFLQLGLYTYMIASKRNIPLNTTNHKGTLLLLLRCFVGMVNTYLVFLALKLIPLSEMTVIGMVSPVITATLSSFFFQEKLERIILVNGLLGIIGVALIAQPAFLFGSKTEVAHSENRTLGLLCSIGTVFVGSTIPIFMKKCSGVFHPLAMSHYFGIFTAIFTPLTMVIQKGPENIYFVDIFVLLIIGVAGTCGQWSMSTSLQYGEAGKVSLLMYSQIVFAFMFEIMIDNRKPDDSSILGTFFILAGFLAMVYKTVRKPKVETSKTESLKV